MGRQPICYGVKKIQEAAGTSAEKKRPKDGGDERDYSPVHPKAVSE
jgi:hypothetical protein